MGLFDGGISAIFASALSGLYLDATLHAGTGEPVYDDDGNITGYTGGADVACKAQVDVATEAMRRAEGFAEGDARILVLAQGIGTITSDHRISVRDTEWLILSAELDAAASHWTLRARANGPAQVSSVAGAFDFSDTANSGLLALVLEDA